MSALPWDRLGELVKQAPAGNAAEVANIDQTAAYYADLFAKFDVSLRDERDAFVALTAIAIAASALYVAAGNGRIPPECAQNGRVVMRSLCFAIAQHVPEEVRP